MTEHLSATEVHGVGSCEFPALVEAIGCFGEETEVLVLAVEGYVVGTPTFLIGSQGTIGEASGGSTVNAEMPRYEAVVLVF